MLRQGNDAPLEGFSDRPHLESVSERGENDQRRLLERGLSRINAPPDRMDRLKALLQREAQMLTLVGHVHSEVEDILQDAYLASYRNLATFERRAAFSTWVTRIAVNRALDRRRSFQLEYSRTFFTRRIFESMPRDRGARSAAREARSSAD